jgi:hypothetical protein
MSSANIRDLIPKEEEEELVILPARGRHPPSPRPSSRREVQSSHSQPTASTSASIPTFTSKSSRAVEDEANRKSHPPETMDDDQELGDDEEHQSTRFYFEDNHCLFRLSTCTIIRGCSACPSSHRHSRLKPPSFESMDSCLSVRPRKHVAYLIEQDQTGSSSSTGSQPLTLSDFSLSYIASKIRLAAILHYSHYLA